MRLWNITDDGRESGWKSGWWGQWYRLVELHCMDGAFKVGVGAVSGGVRSEEDVAVEGIGGLIVMWRDMMMGAVEDGVLGDKHHRLMKWILTLILTVILTLILTLTFTVTATLTLTLAFTLILTLTLVCTLTMIQIFILTSSVSWRTIGMCLTGLGDIVWVWAGPHSLAVHTAHHRAESECVVLQRGIEMGCCAQMDEEVSVALHWCDEVSQKISWQWWHCGDIWARKLLCGELRLSVIGVGFV